MSPSRGPKGGGCHGPRSVELKACEGNRMGSNLYYPADNTGYLYRVKRKRGNTFYFSCARNGCRATANFKKKKHPTTKKGTMKGCFEITTSHSHSEDHSVLHRLKFESACKKRSMYEETPYSIIIKEEKQKWQIEDIKEAGLISTLYQARKRSSVDGPPVSDDEFDSANSWSDGEDDDKPQLSSEMSFARFGYRVERWKWVVNSMKNDTMETSTSLRDDEKTSSEEVAGKKPQDESVGKLSVSELSSFTINDFPKACDVTQSQLLRAYGLDKLPAFIPCIKKCSQNPFCLTGYKIGSSHKSGLESKLPLTQQPRPAPTHPVALQDSPSTAGINSGIQIFYHMRKFRNAINSMEIANTSTAAMDYLIQVLFAEMETHAFKLVPCEHGSVLARFGDTVTNAEHSFPSVAEFMEATIDWLVAETSLTQTIAEFFSVNLVNLTQWECSKCHAVHKFQSPPASYYSLSVSIRTDQAKLQDCILHLQSDVRPAIELLCGQGLPEGGMRVGSAAGCGASCKVVFTVTPKMVAAPVYLLIKNNSVLSLELKKRYHTVFPEHLDLSEHMLDKKPAYYVLSAVVFHNSSGEQTYTAQIKTQGGRWFSFHDEQVLEMNNLISITTQSNPQETHPNYGCAGSISQKYKGRPGERVSRSVCLWVYTKVDMQPAEPFVPPKPSVMNFINSQESQESKQRHQVQNRRQLLLKDLAVRSENDSFVMIPERVLSCWAASEEHRFILPPELLASLPAKLICKHRKLKPVSVCKLKCIRKEMVEALINTACGINFPKIPESRVISNNLSQEKPLQSTAEQQYIVTNKNIQECLQTQTSMSGSDPWNKCSRDLQAGPESSTNVLDLDAWRVQQTATGGETSYLSLMGDEASISAATGGSFPNGRVNVLNTGLNLSGSQAIEGYESATATHMTGDSCEFSSVLVKNFRQDASFGIFDTQNTCVVQGEGTSMTQGKSCPSVDDTKELQNVNLKSEYSSDEDDDSEVSGIIAGCPLLFTKAALCRECVAVHACHIRFLEILRRLHRQFRREAVRSKTSGFKLVGALCLDYWPKIASKVYLDNNKEKLADVFDNACDSEFDCHQSDYFDISGHPSCVAGDPLNIAIDNEGHSSKTEPAESGDLTSPMSHTAVHDSLTAKGLNEAARDEFSSCGTDDHKSSLPLASPGKVTLEKDEFTLINEDIVCEHGQLNPQSYVSWLPEESYQCIVELCNNQVHEHSDKPDFDLCPQCQELVAASEAACEQAHEQKRKLNALFMDKKRPVRSLDAGKLVVLVDKRLIMKWRAYVRSCIRGMPEEALVLDHNALVCYHNKLHYDPIHLDLYRQQQVWVVLWPEEWQMLVEFYGPCKCPVVYATLTPTGFKDFSPDVCSEGCVEKKTEEDFESLFVYQQEIIHLKLVTSTDEIPLPPGTERTPSIARSSCAKFTDGSMEATVTHKDQLSDQGSINVGSGSDFANLDRVGGENNYLRDSAVDMISQRTESNLLEKCLAHSNKDFNLGDKNVGASEVSAINPHFYNEGMDISPKNSEFIALPSANNSYSRMKDTNQIRSDSSTHSDENKIISNSQSIHNNFEHLGTGNMSLIPSGKRSADENDLTQDPTSKQGYNVSLSTTAVAPERVSQRRRAAVEGEKGRRIAASEEDAGFSMLSRVFSSTDSMRVAQNVITEHTGTWPAQQSVYLCWSTALAAALSLPQDRLPDPVLLEEAQLDMTLGELRVKPGDTIYYKTARKPFAEKSLSTTTVTSRSHKIRKALRAKKILKKALTTSNQTGVSPPLANTVSTMTTIRKKSATGRVVELHVTEGSRVGSQLVYPADDTGYVYRVKRIKHSTVYFSCGFTGCRAVGNFKKKGDSMVGIFDLTSYHNHKRNPTYLRRLKFESMCKKRNLEEDLPAAVIIKQELERWQLKEDDVNLNTLNSTLYKARWRHAVDDPSSVPDHIRHGGDAFKLQMTNKNHFARKSSDDASLFKKDSHMREQQLFHHQQTFPQHCLNNQSKNNQSLDVQNHLKDQQVCQFENQQPVLMQDDLSEQRKEQNCYKDTQHRPRHLLGDKNDEVKDLSFAHHVAPHQQVDRY